MLIAHAVTWLPLGDVGYRVNLMSAVFGGVALLLTYLIVARLTGSRLSGALAAWILGFSYSFWANSVVAEVYTLDAALVGAMILCFLRWRDHGRTADLLAGFAFFGLSCANRTTNLLAVPAVVFFVAPAFIREPRRLLAASTAVLPGIALYGLLPLRSLMDAGYRWGTTYSSDGAPAPINLADPSELWRYVSGHVFRPLAEIYDWHDRLREAAAFLSQAWGSLLGGGFILALAGAWWLARRRPRAGVFLLLVALPQTLFFINYAAVDKETMFLNTYFIIAICAGCGLAGAMEFLREQRFPGGAFVVPSASFMLVLLLFWVNFPLVDVSGDYRARTRGEALFATADDRSVVIGGWTDIAPLEYLQTVEHQRPDLALVMSWSVSGQALHDLVLYNVQHGHRVYAMRRDLTLWNVELTDFEFVAEKDWYELRLRSGNVKGDQ